jgi:response regulator NasT
MRVWLLEDGEGEGPGGLGPLLREWAARPGHESWEVALLPPGDGLVNEVRARQPEVLVLAEAHCPAGPWAEEVLALDVGLVAATAADRAEPYRALAERFAVHLVPAETTADGLGLAVLSAEAGRRRQRSWQARLDELRQRLSDRVVIERAKGVLVQRLRVSEEEAYKRLRVLARRQRRPIRDIARSLLETQDLLVPPPDLTGPDRGPGRWDWEQSLPPA